MTVVRPQAGEEEASAGLEAAARKQRMKERTPRVDQAEVLRRTFGFDVFACVRCGGRRRVLAYVKGASGGRAILEHLGLPTACASLAPARGPPRPRGVEAQDSQQAPATHLGRRVPQGRCAACPPAGRIARAAPSAALLGPSLPLNKAPSLLCAINEHVRQEWLLGVIYFKTRLLHRAIAKGLLLAAEMTRSEDDPPSTKIYFVSTRDKARELLVQLRARQDEHRVW